MPYRLIEINERIRSDAAGFLAECDGAYQQKVEQAADHIIQNLSQSPLVLLSGPSGSGKTTTALKIEQELKRRGVNTYTISMDNYFLTFNPQTVPRTEDGAIDLESPKIMDADLLDAHFTALARGDEIIVPKFEFSRQMRNDSRGRPLHLGKNEVVIFEGIHALNDEIFGRHPEATGLYISARSDVIGPDGQVCFKGTWMRLVRRAVRDYNFRGTDVMSTLGMWATVRRGEKLYISPFKQRANIVFDSSLPYEVSIMRHYAHPLLEAVPEENQRRNELLELMAAFGQFEAVDPTMLGKESLLREFIGGGSYSYH